MRADFVLRSASDPTDPEANLSQSCAVALDGRSVEVVSVQVGALRTALVDAADLHLLSKCFSWTPHRNRARNVYAMGYYRAPDGARARVLMHRLLLGAQGQLVDHINGDGLDNRRCNLRLVDPAQNVLNRRNNRNSKSRFRGVSWDAQHDAWLVRITTTGVTRRGGLFKDEVEAAMVFDAMARELHGEFACVNFPRPGERGAAYP